jgi:hypothetical protein
VSNAPKEACNVWLIKSFVVNLSHHNTVQSLTRSEAAGILGVIHNATHDIDIVDHKFATKRKAGP